MGTGGAEAAAGRGRPVSKPARQGEVAEASLGLSGAEALTSAMCSPRPFLPGPTPRHLDPQPGLPETPPPAPGGRGSGAGSGCASPWGVAGPRRSQHPAQGAPSGRRARPQACAFPAPAPSLPPTRLSACQVSSGRSLSSGGKGELRGRPGGRPPETFLLVRVRMSGNLSSVGCSPQRRDSQRI